MEVPMLTPLAVVVGVITRLSVAQGDVVADGSVSVAVVVVGAADAVKTRLVDGDWL